MKRFLVTYFSIAASGLFCFSAAAEDWRYTLSPYIWVPEVDASLDVGPNPPVSSSTSILDVLDGAFLVQGQARRSRWSVVGEVNYLNLSDDFTQGSTSIDAGWDLQGTMVAVGAGYAIYDENQSRVEVMGGLRRWDLEARTTVANRSATEDVVTTDPIVGVRVETPVWRQLVFLGQANIGGDNFGSDRQIDASAQIRVPVRDAMQFSAGYRYLSLDFDEDDLVSDTTMQGPFIAFSFDF